MNCDLTKEGNAFETVICFFHDFCSTVCPEVEEKKIPKLTNLTQNGSLAPLNLLVWHKTCAGINTCLCKHGQ